MVGSLSELQALLAFRAASSIRGAERRLAVATATRKSRAAGQLARRARKGVPESIRFVIFEDNGGGYHWRLVAGDGATLAQSGSFVSYDDAEQAAQRVRSGAASARFSRRGRELGAIDLAARRDRPRDDLDAERWLDDGGGFTREAVARWPDHR